ncbi:MAG: HAD-IIB family hydrolase [Longicatena sp.]
MPKIGLRIIKSSVAVFLCFLISLLRGSSGIVFYSCIAAVLCMQQDDSNTKRVARNRVEGTFIGGFIGMLILLFEKAFIPDDFIILQYALVSFMIIPLIYITVILKKTSASYISCVVFMSITVSHGADINPYLFAFNRILDTLIGIFVAFGINCLHFPYRYDTQGLFVTDLDHTLLNDQDEISPYSKIKLKQLLEKGANICIATSRTPSTFLSIIQDIPLTLPIVIMNGAALYHIKTQEYSNLKVMSKSTTKQLLTLFEEAHVNCFVHTVVHQVLHIYYDGFQNCVEEEYYHIMRKTPYKNYVNSKFPHSCDALFMKAIHEDAIIKMMYETIKKQSVYDEVHVVIRKDLEHSGYSSLEIYSKEAGKKQAIDELMKKYKFQNLFVFGDDYEDLPLMGSATKSFVVKNGKAEIKKIANPIGSNNEDSVVKKMNQLFHSKSKND